MSDSVDAVTGWFFGIFTFLVGAVTFLGCWAYAIASWGWFLGLAFGWIPSAIIAAIAVVLSPLILLAVIVIVFIYFLSN